MATFQAKIGWKRMLKRENKNYSSVPFLSDAKKKFKKNRKKFKKLKYTIIAQFRAKIGWKRLKKRKNKKLKFRFVPFLPYA